jgi:hypothetical protein|tara:strand:+ start:587 stop:1036 length:450 start_codon:yes stop_codon:yes gene_type:complete
MQTGAPVNNHPPVIIRTLTFAGVIPFVMAPMMKAGWLAVPGTPPDIWLWSYAVVISTFMAGAQWGSALSRADAVSLVGSNVFALAVFALALWVQRPAGVLVLAVLFATQLLLDYRQQRLGLVSEGYWRLRCTITPLVCLMLVIYAWIAT